MATTRAEVIDRSVEKAHVWLNDLAAELATEDGHQAYRVHMLPTHLREFLSR
jgi:hypothetical protein